jgi:hypothetical protein
VQLSGKSIVSSPFNKDRETDTFHPSLSGITSTPSTGHSGVDAWISSLRVSPASPSQLLETSELVRIQEMDGPPPFESFGRLDPDGSCLRTLQVSLLDLMGTCTKYAESWPRAAMILDGTAYRRTPVAPLTRGTGSGSLATPTATANQLSPSMMKHPGCRAIANQEDWPTPDSNMGKRGVIPDYKRKVDGKWVQLTINQAVHESVKQKAEPVKETWPTPIAHMARENGCPSEGRRNEPSLTWLANNRWPTPSASDNRDRGHLGTPANQRRQRIGKQLMLSQVVSHTSAQLNPDWVELLMGWPKGWTSLEPLPPGVMEDWLAMDNYWPHDWERDTPRTGKKANNSSRLKAIGNGQVSACVVKAWRLLR